MIKAHVTVIRRRFTLDAAFEIPSTGVTGIFGPSGCGKTTLLRTLAGLPPKASGTIRIDDTTWMDSEKKILEPTHLRRIALVFQHAALFPHLTVEGNLDFAWARRSMPAKSGTLADLIDQCGIDHLLERQPGTLSGGERQRVAIARALATNPRLLLMDEPLSALDQDSRGSFRRFLRQLCADTGIPTIYVSHSISEIMDLADQVLTMQSGRVTNTIKRETFEEFFGKRPEHDR